MMGGEAKAAAGKPSRAVKAAHKPATKGKSKPTTDSASAA
jgi:hypothetical protein